MARRVVRVAALVVTFALLTAPACGGDERISGEINVMVFGAPQELGAYRQIIRVFRRREPDIRVRLDVARDRDDLLARLSTASEGTAPDVFLLNSRFVGKFAARGVLEHIHGRLGDSDALDERGFSPQALDAFRRDDELVCLPQSASALVVYYNRDLFRAGGVVEPSGGWMWNDMVERARKLTKDTNGDGEIDQYGLGVEPSLVHLAPFVWSNGGEVVSHPTRPAQFTLDTAEALDAMEDFFELRGTHMVVPSEREREAADDEARFLTGRLGMLLSTRRATPVFRTITAFDWDVAMLPIHREPRGILDADGFCMAEASGEKDAAWRFLEFALGPEGQRISALAGGTVPTLTDVARSKAFLDPSAKPASSRVFVDAILTALPNISTWPEIEAAAERHLEAGLYKGVPAEEVARRLIEETKPLFVRAE